MNRLARLIRWIKSFTWKLLATRLVVNMFLVGAGSISFTHIVDVSADLGLGWERWTVPFFVDGLALLGKMGRSLAYKESTRKAGLQLMAGAGTVSLVCNVAAGDNPGRKLYGVLVVGGFIAAEWYSAKLAETSAKKPTAAPGKRCPAGCKCGKHKPAKAKSRTRTTRAARARKAAPVSPAPAGSEQLTLI